MYCNWIYKTCCVLCVLNMDNYVCYLLFFYLFSYIYLCTVEFYSNCMRQVTIVSVAVATNCVATHFCLQIIKKSKKKRTLSRFIALYRSLSLFVALFCNFFWWLLVWFFLFEFPGCHYVFCWFYNILYMLYVLIECDYF